ncbi:hypothetical protein EF917_15195 [Streptomyces sp. WAC00469]|nr:hypothetical protein EF917_15195 [Streptomyces sp. WAC00469]
MTPTGVLTTPTGAGLAFPPQVEAGCLPGREGLTRDPVRGPTEDPGSIGFAGPTCGFAAWHAAMARRTWE